MNKILDCTLRDGGYYNNWDFDPSVVSKYLNAMAESGVDYVELGLRNFSKPGFLGAFAYTTESFLDRLSLPIGPSYGVMVDAKTILSSGMPVKKAIDQLFIEEKDSKISLVRVAAHFSEVERSAPIVSALKEKGYVVGFNLMQAGGKPTEIIAEKAKIAKGWEGLDVLYFADSLGNMDSEEVLRIISALRQNWDGELGIHTHNNMAKALDNCLVARKNGVSWLDSTVTGMGRGAGNAQTENLLAVLSKEGVDYKPGAVYELAIRYFESMQAEYGWGSNLLYFLGAQNDVHPTYIQNLLSDAHYGTDEIVGAVEYLGRLENSASYSGEVYKAALSFVNEDKPVSGTTDLVGLANNRELLMLANGPSLERYLSDIKAYIDNHKPIVVAINANAKLSDFIDFYCISHNTKFLSEHDQYKTFSKPVILPKHRFSQEEIDLFSTDTLFDYGLSIKEGSFCVEDDKCFIPYDVTAAYAFSVANVMAPSKLSMIGFDGYEGYDPRQLEMIEILNLAKKTGILDVAIALTPTSYPIKQGSLYAPVF